MNVAIIKLPAKVQIIEENFNMKIATLRNDQILKMKEMVNQIKCTTGAIKWIGPCELKNFMSGMKEKEKNKTQYTRKKIKINPEV